MDIIRDLIERLSEILGKKPIKYPGITFNEEKLIFCVDKPIDVSQIEEQVMNLFLEHKAEVKCQGFGIIIAKFEKGNVGIVITSRTGKNGGDVCVTISYVFLH